MTALFWRLFWARLPLPIGPLALALALGWAWLSVQGWADARAKIARLVAGERIAALEATIAAKDAIARAKARLALEEATARLAATRALAALEAEAAQSEIEKENLNDQIAELLARPVDGACRVDRALADRLRAN